MMDPDYKYLFKIILIGNSGVGKTCLIKRYTDEIYQTTYISTIGVDFKIKTIKINEDVTKLQIWDTAGQERFRTITSSYYRGAHGIMVVFDMTDEESFKDVKGWIDEIRKNSNEDVEIQILGNKADLKDCIQVKQEEVLEILKNNNIEKEGFYEVSAKENIGVQAVFENMAKKLIEKNKKLGFAKKNDKDVINLSSSKGQRVKCCWF